MIVKGAATLDLDATEVLDFGHVLSKSGPKVVPAAGV
jgi:hypothetical protein